MSTQPHHRLARSAGIFTGATMLSRLLGYFRDTMVAAFFGAGPAAALMMTLPPISLPSLAMTGKVLSLRVLGVISLAVFCTGIAAGVLAILLKF